MGNKSMVAQIDAGPNVSFPAIYQGTSRKVVLPASGFASSPALSADTTVIRLCPDADCLISIGVKADTTNLMYLPAKTIEYFAVQPGWKVSGQGLAGAANLYLTEAAGNHGR